MARCNGLLALEYYIQGVTLMRQLMCIAEKLV